MSTARAIVDLLVDHLMHDERFPRMSFQAWCLALRPIEREIEDLLDEFRSELLTDSIRMPLS
jgi:hypothetical protein